MNEADIGGGGGGGGVLEKNGVIRYEKKQKRRSLAEKDADVAAKDADVAAKDADVAAKSESKWHRENVHITCNPLSTPYPYSTPAATTTTTTTTTTVTTSKTAATTAECDDEPKSRSCGSFLPILALIPHSVISFQYLSPKMKFSWWRNKIS
ncbi:uncharacterized protein [Linepithema humile]|uniref:uncharacterized protein n=1 Tax=Linepithema humile TaxID=83485 RepID=UPI00351F149A